ncbi:MAG: nucleotide excision repair endonuclease [Verrucomicrobiota bacterium]
MGAVQLRLLPSPQPLVEKLGTGWFRSVPRRPGVYRMYDDTGRLLYVGKAVDLRARLGSYRRPAGLPGRIRRLVHQVVRIEFELCGDDAAARLRENELLRTCRPPFNRAGTWPGTARYVRLGRPDEGTLEVRLAGSRQDGDYGAFRAGVAAAIPAVLRLLWRVLHPGRPVADLPRELGDGARTWRLVHPGLPAWTGQLGAYLAGESPALVGRLLRELPSPERGFPEAYLAADLGKAAEFYFRGPERNLGLRRRGCPERGWLTPEELDDLPWRAGPDPKGHP